MIRITFIVPYPGMKEIVHLTFKNHPERKNVLHKICVGTFERRDTLDLDTDILIARGFTAQALKKLSVPFIEITVTGFDIVVALNKCLRRFKPKKIAIVGSLNMVYGVDEIKDIFSCELQSYQVEDPRELEAAVRQAREEGAEAVISGHAASVICEELGIPNVIIESGPKTVRHAVDEAIRTVRIMRQEGEKSARFKTIMDYTFEGIISTDGDGRITAINKYARSILADDGRSLEGARLSSLMPQFDMKAALSDGRKYLGELARIRDRTCMVNCVPLDGAGMVVTFSDITRIQELEEQIRAKLYTKGLVAKYSFRDIIGGDPCFTEAVRVSEKFSKVDSNIFICGETGTGKELFAQSVHAASARRNHPFVAINCTALAEDLLESELFGYAEGAFTGASKGGKAGLFELAHRGTVFLDEIGDVSPKLQSRLLRVLQEREIMRIGHDRVIPIDIRIISASNRDLKNLVAEGKFREDLFYRLNVLKLCIPPLRMRRKDIAPLCRHFIQKNRRQLNSPLRDISPEAEEILRSYNWPGNVRELCNFCERLSVLADGEIAGIRDVRTCLEYAEPAADGEEMNPGSRRLASLEKEIIQEALARSTSKKEAARLLGIDASTLWRKMKKLSIS